MRVKGQIQEVTPDPCFSGLWYVVCKCCTKTRGVKFKRGKIIVPVGQENTSLCERASPGETW